MEEEISALKYRDESQSRRLQEKQARLDELEIQSADRQQLQAELDRTLAELAKLKQNPPPAAEPKPAPAIDLPEQLGEIVNFLKQLLPPDTKWPKRVIPELRKFLESKEE